MLSIICITDALSLYDVTMFYSIIKFSMIACDARIKAPNLQDNM